MKNVKKIILALGLLAAGGVAAACSGDSPTGLRPHSHSNSGALQDSTPIMRADGDTLPPPPPGGECENGTLGSGGNKC